MADRAPISGEIYLERKILEEGNFTSKAVVSEIYWKCLVGPEGQITMHMLDNEGNLTGHQETIGRAVFNNRFQHQPGWQEMMQPAKAASADLKPILSLADHHYECGEYNSAEYEYTRALNKDPECQHARFGLGRVYLARGDQQRAKDMFSQLTDSGTATQAEHTHMRNDIAIELRKAGLVKEAVEQYRQALEVTNDDEHLWFNLGRILGDNGQGALAVRLMEKAIQINPEFSEARLYLKNCLDDQPTARQALARLEAVEAVEQPEEAPPEEGLLSISPESGRAPVRAPAPEPDEGPVINLDF